MRLGQPNRLVEDRDRLAALAAEQLDLPELDQRVEHAVGPEPGPDRLSAPGLGERDVDVAHQERRFAAIAVGERRERVRARQLGEPDRLIELGQCFGVVAFRREPAPPIGADPHDQVDVSRSLGVVERSLVVATVGRQVALKGGEHRSRRVDGRRRGVVARPPGELLRRRHERIAAGDVAPRPADHRQAGENPGLLARVGPAGLDGGTHGDRLVEAPPQVEDVRPLAGQPGGVPVAEVGRGGVRRQRLVPGPGEVVQVATQLGDVRVRPARLGDREHIGQDGGGRQLVGTVDRQHDALGEVGIADPGAEHERLVDVAERHLGVDDARQHGGVGRRQDASDERAAEQRRRGVTRPDRDRLEEDPVPGE